MAQQLSRLPGDWCGSANSHCSSKATESISRTHCTATQSAHIDLHIAKTKNINIEKLIMYQSCFKEE